ncbi:MAG: hypothetical protein JJP05_00970 [cyanobacterium endosymbiont of Rhopalodia gibba]
MSQISAHPTRRWDTKGNCLAYRTILTQQRMLRLADLTGGFFRTSC